MTDRATNHNNQVCEHSYYSDCPYCRTKELEAQLVKAEFFVSYCMGLDMQEKIRKRAKDYFEALQDKEN